MEEETDGVVKERSDKVAGLAGQFGAQGRSRWWRSKRERVKEAKAVGPGSLKL